jgi:hypothetical protein
LSLSAFASEEKEREKREGERAREQGEKGRDIM